MRSASTGKAKVRSAAAPTDDKRRRGGYSSDSSGQCRIRKGVADHGFALDQARRSSQRREWRRHARELPMNIAARVWLMEIIAGSSDPCQTRLPPISISQSEIPHTENNEYFLIEIKYSTSLRGSS
jgi:hypothetical protein